MEESTKKIVMELLERELSAVKKGIYLIDAAIITAEAEENTSVIETQNRLKKHALQRIEILQNAIKDLNECMLDCEVQTFAGSAQKAP